jgi:hypothetical protein
MLFWAQILFNFTNPNIKILYIGIKPNIKTIKFVSNPKAPVMRIFMVVVFLCHHERVCIILNAVKDLFIYIGILPTSSPTNSRCIPDASGQAGTGRDRRCVVPMTHIFTGIMPSIYSGWQASNPFISTLPAAPAGL